MDISVAPKARRRQVMFVTRRNLNIPHGALHLLDRLRAPSPAGYLAADDVRRELLELHAGRSHRHWPRYGRRILARHGARSVGDLSPIQLLLVYAELHI
jgi:hypothetical protein